MIVAAIEPNLKRGKEHIPVAEPKLGGKELEYVTNCVKTNWISSKGQYIPKFEESFAKFCNCKYGVSVMNGTAALHLALAAYGITKGDEVIIPTFTMIATPRAVTYTNAKPVLVDAELDTWNIDVKKIEEKITDKTKAIMPVHIYGHPCDMDPILKIAKKHNLTVIEDAAEAHGALYNDKIAGSIGDAGCFSFFANKIITTGEGGIVVTDDKEIADRARIMKEHSFSIERHFWHKFLGFNFRMTNMQAAVGLAQTERADELVKEKIRKANLYNSLLKDVPGVILPPKKDNVKNVYWMYSVRIVEKDYGITRDQMRDKLAERDIETRTAFYPIHIQPCYSKDYLGEEYPNSEILAMEGINLPSGNALTDEQIERVAEAISEIQKEASKK